MTVQEEGAVAVVVAGHVEMEQRSASGQAQDLDRKAAYRLLPDPGVGKANNALDVTVGFPLRIEMRRFRRDAHIVGELRDDFGVPLHGDSGEQRRGIHRESWNVVVGPASGTPNNRARRL